MLVEQGKITIRQAFIIFISLTLSASIRLFPTICAKLGEEACWLAPLIGAVALWALINVLNAIFKNQKADNLSDAFNLVLGKIPGKIVLAVYLFWSMILHFLYLRYYAERLLSSIFPNTDIRFFIITMSIVVYIAARGTIESFARFSEISLLVFTLVFITFFILLTPNVKVSNLFPITYYDAIPALKASYHILGIWGYVTMVFFLGNRIFKKDQIKKQAKKCVGYLALMNALMIAFVVGVLNYKVAQRMALPFFNATKLITFMETLDRMESVLLSVWVVADFIVIAFFAIITMEMTKKLFSVSESKHFAFPVVVLGYFGALYLTANRFEFELFSNKVALPINMILCFAMPVLVLGIGKLRKKI